METQDQVSWVSFLCIVEIFWQANRCDFTVLYCDLMVFISGLRGLANDSWYHVAHRGWSYLSMSKLSLMFVFFVYSAYAFGQNNHLHQNIPSEHLRLRWREDGLDFLEVGLESMVFRGTTWRHVITMAKPLKKRKSSIALVTIWGGLDPGEKAWREKTRLTDTELLERLKQQAKITGGIVASIGQIPFQPIFDGKREDAAISYTFGKFFETGDNTWPLLVPMTKAVSQALNSIERFSASEWRESIKGVVLTGASKRGWTTWLAAAHDSRIKSIVPEVFDILNIPHQLQHQLTSWGHYSAEIGDYSKNGLPAMLATPRGEDLLRLIDPFQKIHQIKIPKLVVLGTNDAYWPVDAASLYFEQLVGKKYLLYIPNARHEITDRKLINANLKVLSRALAGEVSLPNVSFAQELQAIDGQTIWRLQANQRPHATSLWYAQSKTRDFREAVWTEDKPLDPHKDLKTLAPKDPTLFTASFL